MAGIRIISPGTGGNFAGASQQGFVGNLVLPLNPYGVWAFGSDINGAGTIKDQTGQGRTLSTIGAPTQSSLYASTIFNNCYECPFTADQLAAANNAYTFIQITQVASGVNWAGINDNATTTPTRYIIHNTSSEMQASVSMGTGAHIDQITPVDAQRGNRWTMYAAVYQLTSIEAFRRYSSLSAMSTNGATAFTEAAIGGSRAIRIGGDYVGTLVGTGKIAAAVIYNKALTASQLDAIYDACKGLTAFAGLSL